MKIPTTLLLLLAACTTKSSSELATSEISPAFNADVSADGVLIVGATLTTESEEGTLVTYVSLGEGDTLTLVVEGVEVPFGEVEVTNTGTGEVDYVTYAAVGAWVGDEGEVTVALERDAGDPAPSSILPIPPGLDLDTVAGDHPIGTDLVVGWSPTADDAMHGRASGDCIDAIEEDFDTDAGTWTIPGASLDAAEACDVQVGVRRSRDGTVDAAFASTGTATGRQVRDATTTLVP